MALVGAAVLVGAVLQSATGFGFALVTAPAAFAAFDLGTAVTVLALLGAVVSVLVLAERRERAVQGAEVARLGAWAVPGLVAGVAVLAVVAKPVLQVAVGVAVLAAVGVTAGAGPRILATAPVGFVTGLLTTTTGISGPPLLLHFGGLGYSPAATRDSMAASFLVIDALAFPALAVGGKVSLGGTTAAGLVALVALVVGGRPIGRLVFERLDPEWFRRAGFVLAAVAGAASVVAGLTA